MAGPEGQAAGRGRGGDQPAAPGRGQRRQRGVAPACAGAAPPADGAAAAAHGAEAAGVPAAEEAAGAAPGAAGEAQGAAQEPRRGQGQAGWQLHTAAAARADHHVDRDQGGAKSNIQMCPKM